MASENRVSRTGGPSKFGNRTLRRDRLLAVVAVIVVAFALEWSKSVTLPLTFGLFLAAVTWPVYAKVKSVASRGWGAIAALLSFLLMVGAIGWGIVASLQQVAEKAPEYTERLSGMQSSLQGKADRFGVSLPNPDELKAKARDAAMQVSRGALSFFGAAVLVCAFLALGLLEISDSSTKLGCGRHAQRWRKIARRVARDFQRYIVVRTLLGLLNGVLVTLGLMLLGVDLAVLWGVLTFLLNYIPTLGSIVATVPPVLFAFAAEGPTTGMIALLIVGGLQLVLGNWIDPLVQGKYLQLSPLVVLLSVVFWGFIWGVAGAFIGVPLTIVIVLVCREFEHTRFIAVMLARGEQAEELGREPLQEPAGGRTVSV